MQKTSQCDMYMRHKSPVRGLASPVYGSRWHVQARRSTSSSVRVSTRINIYRASGSWYYYHMHGWTWILYCTVKSIFLTLELASSCLLVHVLCCVAGPRSISSFVCSRCWRGRSFELGDPVNTMVPNVGWVCVSLQSYSCCVVVLL